MNKDLKDKIIVYGDMDSVPQKDVLDDEVFIFDNIDGMSITDKPIMLDMPLFGVCISGEATVKVNLTEYHVSANSLFTLMPDHILHGYESSSDFKGLFVGIDRKFVDEMLPDVHSVLPLIMSFKTSPVISLTEEEAEDLKEMHAFLWRRIKREHGIYKRKILQGLLLSVLYKVLTIYKERYNYVETKRTHNEELFFRFVTLVENEFKLKRTVQYYAGRMCITSKHLTSVVKQVSGRTAGDWIDNFVILAAKVMLRSSSHTIQEISAELNFSNQSIFGKYFKQRVGMSPSEYRQKSSD